ncbi:SDR family oxidoreductase [Alterisphingorhabdus coralli]|uniref:SDR family oxidoreductase n=1 Tax=Alterisphingorhabdus coralli TaxID=3071408 RepID=A0AA97F908_9SPHN|nr:SDR family oxidoreductase [Parasphingorhabdus sp. SCSIO 66989]WOE76183.1 SDR family oxidoreductase [Parasphingorhabdus sp. SCSIO 66989]
MATVLITGANRGIGLELAKQYAAAGHEVIATARNVDAADELAATGAKLLPLNVADDASRDAFVAAIGDQPIDVFINNAGIGGAEGDDPEGWLNTLMVNTVAPSMLAQALKANVASSEQKKLIAMSSTLGSIAMNDSGGMMRYRSSKAALNAAWQSLAIDMRDDGITVATLHPGWVQTDMGGPNASITTPESASGLIQVIDALTFDETGAFKDYTGKALPW